MISLLLSVAIYSRKNGMSSRFEAIISSEELLLTIPSRGNSFYGVNNIIYTVEFIRDVRIPALFHGYGTVSIHEHGTVGIQGYRALVIYGHKTMISIYGNETVFKGAKIVF